VHPSQREGIINVGRMGVVIVCFIMRTMHDAYITKGRVISGSNSKANLSYFYEDILLAFMNVKF
jgi:hypothetical protein